LWIDHIIIRNRVHFCHLDGLIGRCTVLSFLQAASDI
jgi:hypothetical protein